MNDNSILTSLPAGSRNLPQWLADCQRTARERLATCPLPTRLDETWRFGDIKRADVSRFVHAPAPDGDLSGLLAGLPVLHEESIRIVFINGVLTGMPDPLPEGLSLLPLTDVYEDICKDDGDVDWAKLGSGRFAVLNIASLTDGVALVTDPGADIKPVVELVYAVTGDLSAIFPHTFIKLGENSRLQVLERHISLDGGEQLAVGLQRIKLCSGARLDYGLLQQLNDQSLAVELGNAALDAGAQIAHLSSHCGAVWSRQELVASLQGNSARAEILSANMLDGNRVVDQRTYQDHKSGGAYSNLLYKNVLNDSVKSVFSGMIKVEPGSHETDAYQSNRNLILSDNAESNSLPGLEILADNVRCSHGSASSSIDPEQIFYLRSRGITAESAGQMIAKGFLKQAFDGLESSVLAESMVAAIFPEAGELSAE